VPTQLRGAKTPEGEFIRATGCKWVTSAGYMDVVTAGGTHLGHFPSEEILEEFRKLPGSDRRPGGGKVGDLAPGQSAVPTPPPGGLVLRVHTRAMARDGNGGYRAVNVGDYPLVKGDVKRFEELRAIGNFGPNVMSPICDRSADRTRLLEMSLNASLLFTLLVAAMLAASAAAAPSPGTTMPAFPPGWLPLNKLAADTPTWSDFRKIEDKVHLYLPPGVKQVRGVFVCFVFHSADPRELADLWQFALVTVPWPFEYDLGLNDKRNGRFKAGHPVGDMGRLLDYLNVAAKETNHAELAVAPIVGWVGQNGSHLCADLHKRAPARVIAWADAFPNRLEKYPELTAAVPFAYAWEFTGKDEKERRAARETKLPAVAGKPTPPPDLRCRANTYGFSHGIYSKFNFFAAFLDRCIRLRLPAELPPAGEPLKLRPIDAKAPWAGDYNVVGQWNAIAPYGEAAGMVEPVWLPDAYMAWAWRSYHSAKPDLKLTAPVVEYRKKDGKWGGPQCGLGYGGTVAAGAPLTFAADGPTTYAKVEFHDGDRVVGTASSQPWKVDGVKLDRGLHVLFAVGVTADGSRAASRPAFLVVK
jgi:hypothetical protein